MEQFDVLVLGGGLAGVSAALRAAELGAKVSLIEKDEIGRVGFQRRFALFMEGRNNISSSSSWEEYKAALNMESEVYCRSLREKLNAVDVSIVEGVGRLANQGEMRLHIQGGLIFLPT